MSSKKGLTEYSDYSMVSMESPMTYSHMEKLRFSMMVGY